MPNEFSWFSIAVILVATLSGGLPPLRAKTPQADRYPLGEAFASGVFVALALVMMLPASFQLFRKALPDSTQPVASLIAIVSMLSLLGVSHFVRHLEADLERDASAPSSPLIPILMTVMIAVPSFFMGAALGVSATEQAVLILIAILLHKSSAAFALALKLSESSLSRGRVRLVFGLFAFSTPT